MVSGFQADAWIRNNTKQIKIIPLSKYKKNTTLEEKKTSKTEKIEGQSEKKNSIQSRSPEQKPEPPGHRPAKSERIARSGSGFFVLGKSGQKKTGTGPTPCPLALLHRPLLRVKGADEARRGKHTEMQGGSLSFLKRSQCWQRSCQPDRFPPRHCPSGRALDGKLCAPPQALCAWA